MFKLFFSAIAIVFLIGAYWTYSLREPLPAKDGVQIIENESNGEPISVNRMEIVAQDLEIPWAIEFLPNGDILITERAGKLKKLGADGFTIDVPGVAHIGEGGLLGMALHPNFKDNNWIYLYHTVRSDDGISNVVERFTLSGNELNEKQVIVENIPGAGNHDGGRIKFGPDGFLYVATGDAQNSADAQDKNSLAGKILRLKDDGGIPQDNPFENAVYSYGHRNVQGLTWDRKNRLWATEHGRSGLLSGYDELNLVEKGKNYGWPAIQGDENQSEMETPKINSGANDTWAPSGAVYFRDSIFFAGLRGQALYEYKINDEQLVVHLKGELGRLRNVVTSPDGKLYILTNNTDGRGTPKQGDDKIIKLSL